MTKTALQRDPDSSTDESDLRIEVHSALAIAASERAEVLALFRVAYREANEAYLIASLGKFRFIATARAGGVLVGFGLGEARLLDLPRLPRQAVTLGGICCIDAGFRRRGLFRRLETAAFLASDIELRPRFLGCGRVAHPASFGTMVTRPSHVPRRGVSPTPWHREVGAAVAAAYGVADFDRSTFVCRGRGVPIGYPVLDIEVKPEEWEIFATVDRSRGDSLLGLCWFPDAPPDW